MNAAELDALLRQFLVDHKLNANERDELKHWANENVDGEQKRAAARGMVFDAARNAAASADAVELLTFVEEALEILLPMKANESV